MSDCADILQLLDKHTPKNLLDRPRLRVDAELIRRESIRAAFHRPGKNYRTPKYVLKALQEAYARLGSLEKTAREYKVCKSHVFYLFKKNRIPTKKRPQRSFIFYKGIKYVLASPHNYYYQTTKGKQGISLHKVIWQERHGPVPDDCRLIFVSKDYNDFSDANIRCVPKSEYYRHVIMCRYRKDKAA